MGTLNAVQISNYVSADLHGKRDYLIGIKKRSHKALHRHFALLKKDLGPDLFLDPDKVYPKIGEHLRNIAIAIRKMSISMNLLNRIVLSGMYLAKDFYKYSPNDELKAVIHDIDHHIMDDFRNYVIMCERFRDHIPFKVFEDASKNQTFPSRQVHEAIKALTVLEEREKEMSRKLHHFFKRHKVVVKDLFAAVQSLDRGKLGSLEKFKSNNPTTVVGALCMCFTVMGYLGVFITLGYGIAGLLGGGTVLRALFGVSKGMAPLKLLGNFFFSSGTSTLSIIIDKGAKLAIKPA
ncbi:hypothetical protein HN419_01035 [Candidatus Woesearchaeota archaeon]|jgi:hypothetical protein|nr:hypothetical protein [Candidatus Woesearchaeota archaeon]MBT3537418.1 hypothetical protein [Candidatus Woesearchaeota archaeon]MBT4697781.1 hypothetical protein [Candidatus Woesearchaeota archaeon]MBT4717532.1 hypothetical protein [Candidatus Woesearchaeota archaeon]MBT7106272.1 hypothetical protein [Candidatus Woesearchaeota archaeon]